MKTTIKLQVESKISEILTGKENWIAIDEWYSENDEDFRKGRDASKSMIKWYRDKLPDHNFRFELATSEIIED